MSSRPPISTSPACGGRLQRRRPLLFLERMERRRLPLAQVVLGLQRGDMFGVGELLVGEAIVLVVAASPAHPKAIE